MNRSPFFKRLFFWLSGAGTETLEQCPNWEQRKYVAFGATVLVPCAFAFIACAYALSTLTDNPRVIYGVAAVWAFIILPPQGSRCPSKTAPSVPSSPGRRKPAPPSPA